MIEGVVEDRVNRKGVVEGVVEDGVNRKGVVEGVVEDGVNRKGVVEGRKRVIREVSRVVSGGRLSGRVIEGGGNEKKVKNK